MKEVETMKGLKQEKEEVIVKNRLLETVKQNLE
jgi:hypothetical protein